MDSEQREQLAQRVLELSPASQTEVLVTSSNSELTRFSRNTVHQNVAEADVSVRVRALIGQRSGSASTNLLDDVSLREVVHRAEAMARLAPEDPDQPELPRGGNVVPPPGAFVTGTAHATPELRAQMADAVFRAADDHGYWCAGFVTTESDGVTVVNSSGARASFERTDCGVNVKMNAADSSGFGEGYHNDVTQLDARDIGDVSARKAKDSAHPQTVEPGPWTVILEPAAFGELISYLADHFSAQSYEEGSSFFADGLNQKYFGDNVTIGDDYAHPLNPGMPFDYEGQPTQRIALVENGVARNFVTDSYYAQRLKCANTGHALPAPNAYGPQALHLVIGPGSKPLNELISETKRGLLITRFWYIRTVDQKKAIVTGMTRDGTFLIENGELRGGVRNMRFNQSILEALRHCEFSNSLHRTGGYSYSLVAPAAKIEGFRFSSGTNF
ncbi:MAG TPA: TldD/PmbA family protein [Candidatus Baltobacteraceae bacterium]|jgi:predicted Zn-dependent protease|nr:TldD/PmbA family protein [Candidatus Baltobacteraceae bacterium]